MTRGFLGRYRFDEGERGEPWAELRKGVSPVIQFSTAARVAHDLGLAACFGGTLFGKGVFNPSVGVVRSKSERGKIGGTTWNRFNALNTASFVVAAATWLAWRRGMAGGGMDLRARNLVLAKDVLMGVTGSTGLTVLVIQILLYRQAPEGTVPLENGSVPAPEASARAALLQRAVSTLGSVHVALFVGVVALTTVLSAETVSAARPSVPSRSRY